MSPFSISTLCAAFAVSILASAMQASESVNTVAFSDPSRPGTLKISLGRGDLQIEGSDSDDVVVRAEGSMNDAKPRQDDLRILSAGSGLSLVEKDNVVTLDATISDRNSDKPLRITVPHQTAIVVQNALSGVIHCSGIEGDIEINSLDAKVALENVAGGVVVATMNGDIRADVDKLQDGKPLSFTSIKGEVTLRLPANAKATVRLRTQSGSVLTDFGEDALVTRTETTPGTSRATGRFSYRDASGKTVTAEVSSTAESSASGHSSSSNSSTTSNTPPAGERQDESSSTNIASVTITGGKLVTGTLNGGGPEINVSTMNGDVILRKRDGTAGRRD